MPMKKRVPVSNSLYGALFREIVEGLKKELCVCVFFFEVHLTI